MEKNCSNCLANRTFWGKRSALFLYEIRKLTFNNYFITSYFLVFLLFRSSVYSKTA